MCVHTRTQSHTPRITGRRNSPLFEKWKKSSNNSSNISDLSILTNRPTFGHRNRKLKRIIEIQPFSRWKRKNFENQKSPQLKIIFEVKKIIVRLTVSKLERECAIVFEFRSVCLPREVSTNAPQNTQDKTPFRQYFYGKEIICITESIGRLYDVWQIALQPVWRYRLVDEREKERERRVARVDHFASCAGPNAAHLFVKIS